jgi:three-Cys-motif partner protein
VDSSPRKKRGRVVRASDGLRARDNGPWAREKLEFLQRFAPPAFKVAKTKLSRHYLDLFAGPGLNKIRKSGEEIEGSPLRALSLCSETDPSLHFTHATFVNRNRLDHGALETRVARRFEAGDSVIAEANVRCVQGDANEVLGDLLRDIHSRSWVFVFADITAPKQLPWSTIEALTARGHTSLDLYVLFPLDMAVNRLISFKRSATENCARVLTTFYGCEDWRALSERRITSAQSRTLRRGLEDLYLKRLSSRWQFARTVADIRRGPNHRLYKMMFATNDPAADRVARWWLTHDSRRGIGQIGFDL